NLGFGTLLWQWGKLTSVQWRDSGCLHTFYEQYVYAQAGQVTQKRLSMTDIAYVYVDGYFIYDGEGRMTSYQTPMSGGANGENMGGSYTYTRDPLGRATSMYINHVSYNESVVSSATYGAAGLLSGMTYNDSGYGYIESRQYNANLQLTRL